MIYFNKSILKTSSKKRPYYQKKKGEDIKLNVEIDFIESIFGVLFNIIHIF